MCLSSPMRYCVVLKWPLPPAEAIDQWFETFQNYEVTLVSDPSTQLRLLSHSRTGRNGCCLS